MEWQDLAERQPRYFADRPFYDHVRAARSEGTRRDRFVIPPSSGCAFIVKGGQTFRVIQETGPQVASVCVWNADNTQETLLPAGTWSQEGIFARPYGRPFSGLAFGKAPRPGLPWRRPMMTCIEDTVAASPPQSRYHHHFLGTFCSPEFLEMRFGVGGLRGCSVNLVEAIAPFGLKAPDLLDSINLFQKAYLDMTHGKLWVVPSDARAGDFVEFFAEFNLLVAVSVCPLGDGTADPTRGGQTLRPVRVEIYDTGIEPREFRAMWTDWKPSWEGRWIAPEGHGR
jgi:uncharacterized protein YcgI (DUF1989 family)